VTTLCIRVMRLQGAQVEQLMTADYDMCAHSAHCCFQFAPVISRATCKGLQLLKPSRTVSEWHMLPTTNIDSRCHQCGLVWIVKEHAHLTS
jgi:hypothetical protein